jgi:hypothetical protein
MALQPGQCVYYVSSSGNVSLVTVVSDDSNGPIMVKYPNGQNAEVSAFSLFATEAAANRAALSKAQTAKTGNGVKFVTKPR